MDDTGDRADEEAEGNERSGCLREEGDVGESMVLSALCTGMVEGRRDGWQVRSRTTWLSVWRDQKGIEQMCKVGTGNARSCHCGASYMVATEWLGGWES